jgi:hypothetical protein
LLLHAVDGDDHFFEHRAEQLLAIAIGGRRGVPHPAEVTAERADRRTILIAESTRLLFLLLSDRELGFAELAETRFPLGLEATSDEAIVRIDSAVASLGALRFITCTLYLSALLRECGVVPRLAELHGAQRCFDSSRRDRGEERVGDSLVVSL